MWCSLLVVCCVKSNGRGGVCVSVFVVVVVVGGVDDVDVDIGEDEVEVDAVAADDAAADAAGVYFESSANSAGPFEDSPNQNQTPNPRYQTTTHPENKAHSSYESSTLV